MRTNDTTNPIKLNTIVEAAKNARNDLPKLHQRVIQGLDAMTTLTGKLRDADAAVSRHLGKASTATNVAAWRAELDELTARQQKLEQATASALGSPATLLAGVGDAFNMAIGLASVAAIVGKHFVALPEPVQRELIRDLPGIVWQG